MEKKKRDGVGEFSACITERAQARRRGKDRGDVRVEKCFSLKFDKAKNTIKYNTKNQSQIEEGRGKPRAVLSM